MSTDPASGLPGLTGLTLDELDLLADLLAGEGTEEQVDRVAADARLAGALADLEAAQAPLAADLAGLPDVQPPAGFLDRLAAAIAAEPPYVTAAEPHGTTAGLHGTSEPHGTAAPADSPAAAATVLPLPRDRRPAPERPPWLLRSAAAAVFVLALVGLGFLLRDVGGGSSDADSTASRASSAEAGPPVSSTGTNYTDAAGVGAALPALLRGGASAAPFAAAAPVAPGAADSLASGAADPLARLRQPGELAGCLSSLGPGTVPLAVDYARYAGVPALVVVLPSTSAGKLDVFALGAGCTATNDETLVFLRVDRP